MCIRGIQNPSCTNELKLVAFDAFKGAAVGGLAAGAAVAGRAVVTGTMIGAATAVGSLIKSELIAEAAGLIAGGSAFGIVTMVGIGTLVLITPENELKLAAVAVGAALAKTAGTDTSIITTVAAVASAVFGLIGRIT